LREEREQIMQARVIFRLNEQGQIDAIKKNVCAQNLQTITGEIEDRDLPLLRVTPEGSILGTSVSLSNADMVALDIHHVSASSLNHYDYDLDLAFSVVPGSVREVLDAMHAAKAKREAERQAEKEKEEDKAKQRTLKEIALLDTELQKISQDANYLALNQWGEYSPIGYAMRNHPGHPTVTAISERKRIHAEKDAAEKEAKKRAEEEKEAAKSAYIREWIGLHGTESQKARLTENLLPRQEAVSAIAEHALNAEGLRDADYPSVHCENDHEGDELKHDITGLASLTDEQYTNYTRVKLQFPSAAIEPVQMESWYQGCECELVAIPAAQVTVVVGPFQFVGYFQI
jgi:hypothetical protein